jgi:membrane protein YqaA with SNARE-associated domain
MFKKTYEWVLHWAKTPYAGPALFAIAFIESSFFPIPPDVLLIALCLGHVTKSFRFALICSVGSVLGGVFGYAIGYFLMDSVGQSILNFYHFHDKFEAVKNMYHEYGALAVFIAGFSPLPYKVFTITSGVMELNIVSFVIASAVSRSLRFFLFATLFYFVGPKIKPYLDRYFVYIAWAFVALVVLGFLGLKFFI